MGSWIWQSGIRETLLTIEPTKKSRLLNLTTGNQCQHFHCPSHVIILKVRKMFIQSAVTQRAQKKKNCVPFLIPFFCRWLFYHAGI